VPGVKVDEAVVKFLVSVVGVVGFGVSFSVSVVDFVPLSQAVNAAVIASTAIRVSVKNFVFMLMLLFMRYI
jgi:hypothetical protein